MGLPDLHEIAPTSQGFGRVQVPPAVHETQLPALQTMSIPHEVPSETAFPVSWQDIVPVWQLVVPVSHGLMGVQLTPLVQEVHVPPLHTLFVPHDVPSAAFPATVQTEVPVEQDVIPVLHRLLGWQLMPAVQEAHVPALHTLLVPHDVPSATFPDATQAEVPVEQDVTPVLQRVLGWQVVPAVQAPQVPLSHTLLVPHDVPFARFPVSVQTEVPVAQDVAPVLQALLGWQVVPAVQAPQVPALHTLLVPQVVPLARFCPVSEQVIAGEQAVMPA